MPWFSVYGRVVGTKWLGYVEAADKGEAETKICESKVLSVTMCRHCKHECETPSIEMLVISEVPMTEVDAPHVIHCDELAAAN